MGLTWKGDQVKRNVARAAAGAIDETNRAAADRAAAEWPRDTGLSAESIDVLDSADTTGAVTRGSFGAQILPASPEYSESSRARVLLTEIGFRGKPGRNILRRAADAENAELRGRIRRRIR